ncbi:MAG TPA: hypothetical protein VJA27_02390 [Patescibacteria group bacterium]|nr:hypothetical protein [Patescibacteria group bacterium]
MKLTTLTRQELYEEIIDLAQGQGVNSQETWNELVDETVESHLDLGELDVDQDTEGLKEGLYAQYGEYKHQMAEEDLGGVEDEGELKEEKGDVLGETRDTTLDE